LRKNPHKRGGRVVGLLGNHEVMNIMGDLRYVTPANYASFADGNSENRQKAAYEEYVKWRNSHASLLAEVPHPMELTEAELDGAPSSRLRRAARGIWSKGRIRSLVAGTFAVAEVEGIIFLHGGIHPDLGKTKIDAMNNRIRDEIKAFDDAKQYFQNEKLLLPFFNSLEISNVLQAEVIAELKSRVPASNERQTKIQEFLKQADWFSLRVDGPLWFRGYDQWSDEEGAPKASKLLQDYKAAHIVVGHTVQKGGRIRPRFGNKIFLIDTGMLSSYYAGGMPSALEICADNRIIAVYLDQQVVLDPAGSAPQNRASPQRVVPEEAHAVSEKARRLTCRSYMRRSNSRTAMRPRS